MSAASRPLRFRPDHTFKIVQFTDTHVQNGEGPDRQTADLIRSVLDAEQPDLVIFTGDVIDGKHCVDPADSWLRAVMPVASRGIPWAAVFGNHDDEGLLDRYDLMHGQRAMPGCLAHMGPSELSGVGNYVLPLWGAETNQAVAHLYCLDSNAYSETGLGKYGWIKRDQIDWYVKTSQELTHANRGQPLPALAFFHIPLPEYDDVWDYGTCYGVKYEPVCSPVVNTGMFAAMHEMGDVMGVFVGHDHVNDFIGDLHGIRLAYGRASGYNTYGREGMARGARVIQLVEGEHDFTTWLRLEGGEQVTEQPVHTPESRRVLSDGTDNNLAFCV